jgi:hypothetical protein
MDSWPTELGDGESVSRILLDTARYLSANCSHDHLDYAGMFAIITPVMAIPIIAALATGSRQRKRADVEETDSDSNSPITVIEHLPWKERAVSLFWQLDLIGLLLLIGGAGMFLVTITLANNKTKSWGDGEYQVERR